MIVSFWFWILTNPTQLWIWGVEFERLLVFSICFCSSMVRGLSTYFIIGIQFYGFSKILIELYCRSLYHISDRNAALNDLNQSRTSNSHCSSPWPSLSNGFVGNNFLPIPINIQNWFFRGGDSNGMVNFLWWTY